MTKAEYVLSLQKKADKITEESSPKGKKRKVIIRSILVFGTIASLGIGSLCTHISREQAYNAYQETPAGIRYEDLGYNSTFEIWNENLLGADINSILSGGKLLFKDDVSVIPKAKDNVCTVQVDGKTVGSIKGSISYINSYNNSVLFRNDKTRDIQSFDILSGKYSTIVSGNVGETLVYDGNIYFVDFEQQSHLFLYRSEEKISEEIVPEPVLSFAVFGDSIIYLSTNNNLYKYDFSTKSATSIVNNIERFFLDGDIIAESKNTVFRFETLSGKPSKIYASDSETFSLVGCSNGVIFFEEDGKLYTMSDNEPAEEIVSDIFSKYSTVVSDVEGNLYALAYNDSIGVTASCVLLTLTQN